MTQYSSAVINPHRLPERESLREQVERALSARIVAGEFAPGDVLTVPTFAAEYGVSATPVREAMLELTRKGFLSPVRNKGFRVNEVTEEELHQIVAVRQLLEVPPVRELAGNLTSELEQTLRDCAARIERAYRDHNFEQYITADTEFHMTLIETSGNAHLSRIVNDLRMQTRLRGLVGVENNAALERSVNEHSTLVDLLAAGDADAAADLVHRHIGHVVGIWGAH